VSLGVVLRDTLTIMVKNARDAHRNGIAVMCARLEHREHLFLVVIVNFVLEFQNDRRRAFNNLIRRFSILFGPPTEQPRKQGQTTHNDKRSVSDLRSSALRIDSFSLRVRSLRERLFPVVQRRLASGLGRSDRLKLLALLT